MYEFIQYGIGGKLVKKITVVGLGYVGLSIAVLLSKNNKVLGLDISERKVDLINKRICPFKDGEITFFFKEKELDLCATTNEKEALSGADYIFIATPTDYNPDTNYFDTSSVDEVIDKSLSLNKKAVIVIKSTVPIGYTEKKRKQYSTTRIVFSPEFLREGKALYDNLYPSRIVVGDREKTGEDIANLILEGAYKKDVPILLTGPTEAEAIKLFANTYLAMRVAFFNEVDMFAERKSLNSYEIIKGICADPRIGDFYNNPSFGYGGYCLPKDTKQMLSDFIENGVPNKIIRAVVESNEIRKKNVAEMVAKRNPKVVGVYMLSMKKGSDNFRHSSLLDVIDHLREKEIEVVIYDPMIAQDSFNGCKVIKDLGYFKANVDVIIANRATKELKDVWDKVYTRDLFGRD
jgi:UDPglucose 6-dehydrogenase